MNKSKRSKIILICDNCGILYPKDKSEYLRNKKLNRKSFCSRKCSGRAVGSNNLKYINNIPPPGYFGDELELIASEYV